MISTIRSPLQIAYRRLRIHPIVGHLFHTKVELTNDAFQFAVSLCLLKDTWAQGNSCPFHIKFVKENKVIYNTMVDNVWGEEEYHFNGQLAPSMLKYLSVINEN